MELMSLGATIIAASLIHQWCKFVPSLVAGIIIGAAVFGGLFVYDKETTSHREPDVTLRFVYAKSPLLILVNDSAVVAREIKWSVALWNIDDSTTLDPLPIPAAIYEFIRPKTISGPMGLFNTQL